MDARRLAYLDAMGIDVWEPRRDPSETARPGASEAGPRLILGDGEGDILCIAPTAEDAGLKLAADISGAMRTLPVWAWPDSEPGHAGQSMTVDQSVGEHLFTRIVVFGSELSQALFAGQAPEVIAAARVHVVPGLDQLGRDREAKRLLWNVMREQGFAAGKAKGKAGA